MKKNTNKIMGWIPMRLVLFVCGALPLFAQAENSNDIEYSGTLIAVPCTINPIYENMYISFGDNVNTKDLYSGQRGAYSDREFDFQLKDCDTSLGSSISGKFTGASVTTDGLLNLDAGSIANGVVIGLETMSGRPLPINNNQVEPILPIVDGDMTIRLRAYLKADAQAMQNKSITPGPFWATLTYTLIYQ